MNFKVIKMHHMNAFLFHIKINPSHKPDSRAEIQSRAFKLTVLFVAVGFANLIAMLIKLEATS